LTWGGQGPFGGLCCRVGGRRTGATENKPKVAYLYSRGRSIRLILLNNPPFLEIPSACVKIAQRISPADGVQTILIFVEGVLMVFLGVDFWPVGVLQQNPTYGLTPFS